MQQLTGPKLGKEYDKAILSPCLFNLYAEYIMLNAELNESQAGIKIKWSEVAQSCLTLCNPVDCSPPGSSVHRILQARILEWVAISFSRGSSQPRDRTQGSNPGLRHCRQMLYGRSHQGNITKRNRVYFQPKGLSPDLFRMDIQLFHVPWTLGQLVTFFEPQFPQKQVGIKELTFVKGHNMTFDT